MTAASRALALAQARRYPCTVAGCTATLPSRVECRPRADGRYDVVTRVCPDALRQHTAGHAAAARLRAVS